MPLFRGSGVWQMPLDPEGPFPGQRHAVPLPHGNIPPPPQPQSQGQQQQNRQKVSILKQHVSIDQTDETEETKTDLRPLASDI
jgi:hypothetical protein